MTKFALINFGNEESYGLLFVGTELKKHGKIKFFDAQPGVDAKIVNWQPDYICFSPMTTFIQDALAIEALVKLSLPNCISIYGGHHVTNSLDQYGDLTVIGSVTNLDINARGRIYNGPTLPEQLTNPARYEYYRDIPRMRDRYRKVMLSVTGCPFTCTYCSSSSTNTNKLHGTIKHGLRHRKVQHIIEEARYIKDTTHEIEWVDDDMLYGSQTWLSEFIDIWVQEINIPMYISTTSISALRVSDNILKKLRKTVNCIGMGVQCIRPESLKLMGRKWDNPIQIKQAYDRLVSFGYKVNLQCIVGLPVQDPVEEALDTIEFLTNIAPGSIISCYPLQIYPGTVMNTIVNDTKYKLNPESIGDTNTGLPAIDFGTKTNNRLRNICKLATFAVKYGVGREWLQSLLDIDLNLASKPLSELRYKECVRERLPEKADKIFKSILGGMSLRF